MSELDTLIQLLATLPGRPARRQVLDDLDGVAIGVGDGEVGVAGPVGSGKTALIDCLSRRLWPSHNLAVVTNDIYTREDAEFLRQAPHTTAVSRPDEVKAAKEPVLRWRP